jgi:UDP-N-acetyl-D-mannosaminuronate dehydrogenase
MRKILIIGMGEVGTAHANLLARVPPFEVRGVDLHPERVPEAMRVTDENYQPDVLIIAIRYQPDFVATVTALIKKYRPQVINVLSTVPPGTCMEIGPQVSHSTTRGLHPHLEEGLLAIVKHVGGAAAAKIARVYEVAGMRCLTHALAKTTELAHILNNAAYGVSLMFADEMARLCREYGVDYFQAVMGYTVTNNEGFSALDQSTKVRMILTPPGGRIGGHCVRQSAALIPEGKRTPMLAALAKYNDEVKS